MILTDAQRARLSKPVRDEIARLEADLAHCREILATGPDDSDTFADPYATSPRPLGRGIQIRFGGTGHEETVDARWDGEHNSLVIKGNEGLFRKTMAILPESANTVRICFREQ